ncbi:MAG: ligand-binding sensor domain-containing protein, partial [Ferruginibacter sp.]
MLHAQTYQFKLFNNKDGLSNNAINAIEKDAHGFLWIATNNGLNRFDGSAFDVFLNDPSNSATIGSNYVQSLYVSSNNKLWAGTESGISSYNEKLQQFKNYAPDTLVMPKIGQSFTCINEDENGNIWFGGEYDLLIFNPTTKKIKSSGWANFASHTKPTNGNNSRVVVLSISAKNKKEFWILTTYGLYSVNISTQKFIFYPCTYINDFYGSKISYTDENKNCWISTYNNGMLVFN